MSIANAMILVIAQGLVGQSLPDELDLFRTGSVKPQINLLLDQSCSMNAGVTPTNCSWWAAQYNNGDTNLNKNQQMRAALVGCTSDTDGLIHQWFPYANFAMREFPARPVCTGALPTGCTDYPEWCTCNTQAGSYGHDYTWGVQIAGFDSTEDALKAGAQSVGASGNTPMTLVMAQGAKDFNAYFTNGNTKSCRPSYNVLFTDGNPNASAAAFDYACNGDNAGSISASSPWLGSAYNASEPDLLCSVNGDQTIKTHTIGFGTLATFNPNNLQKIANQGGGKYYYAANITALTQAFQTLVTSVVSNTSQFFSSPAIQRQGLNSDNYTYVAPYEPMQAGSWRGNLKKFCIYPYATNSTTQYDTTRSDCVFTTANGTDLLTNPNAKDVWTSTTASNTDIGGAGQKIQETLGTAGTAASTPYWPRNIVSWRPGTSSYVAIKPSTWSDADSWVVEGDRRSFVNQLHGYTFESSNDSTGNPVNAGPWPLGDVIHTPVVTVRYSATAGVCESQAGKCFLIFGGNDGMVHFVDAYDGSEKTALIPQDFWQPNNVVNNNLADIQNQPTSTAPHRYYIDGGMRVFHLDTNSDGAIQSTEKAYLIFGLGRGGKAYYMIPISTFNGTLNASDNPIYPLTADAADAIGQLKDTWAAPWLGQLAVSGSVYSVAAFGTGHIPSFDVSTKTLPSQAPAADTIDPLASPKSDTCANAAVAAGLSAAYCSVYAATGYSDSFPESLGYGPFSLTNAIAYRVHFSNFDMDPNDEVWLQTSQGRAAAALTGTGQAATDETWSAGLQGGWSPWIYDTQFQIGITLSGNGNPDAHTGFVVDTIEYRTRTSNGTAAHYPTVYIVDLARWNGSTAPAAFTASPSAGGVLARFTSDCTASGTGGASSSTCVDTATSPDLKYMTCPISGELSAKTAGEKLEGLYWGDECGQIWAADLTSSTNNTWSVRRLINLNPVTDMSSIDPQGSSKDFRKLFRRLDIVPSGCPGRRVTGVYFGTGDVQRPVATDELHGGLQNYGTYTATQARDLVGAIWDDGSISNLDMGDLLDATTVDSVDPRQTVTSGGVTKTSKGWMLQLDEHERMLRDPVVLFGVAYFKTFTPTSQAQECVTAVGQDAVWAVNNCTAQAAVDVNNSGTHTVSDRKVWTNGAGAIGGDLSIVMPKSGAPTVSGMNMDFATKAKFNPSTTNTTPTIFNWRLPREGN